MPHCVIEYAKELENSYDIAHLVQRLHQGMNDSGLFQPEAIKTRAHACGYYITGGTEKPFVHTTIYLLNGRTTEQKKALASKILTVKKEFLPKVKTLSVDVRDLNREIYSK